MKHKKLTITAASLLAALTTQVQAGFFDWLGGTSNDWSDNTNWQGGSGVGVDDTARIFNSDIAGSPDPTPNNTVLKSGDSSSVSQVWLGNQSDGSLESGALTVESGATLTTSGGFVVSQNSTLVSSGDISVGDNNGMIVRDSAVLTFNSGSTLNKLTLQESSTATLEAGSTVTTIQNPADSAQLILNGTYAGNLFSNNGSSAVMTVNGTLNGNFGIGSYEMHYIGETGIVNGDIEVNSLDQITVAGSVNGRFAINQNGLAVIESTADIRSNSASSWIYNTPSIQWNVGADGSVGTLRTNRLETSLDAYDGEWRYGSSAEDLVVDLTNCAVYDTPLTLQLVTGIQDESTFASNVTFLRDGADVTADFAWDGAGTGSFTGVLANPDADGDGLPDSVETGTGIYVDSTNTGTDPNVADTDGDGLSDSVDLFPNDGTETVDTDGDGVGDNGDVHPGYNDSELSTYLSNNSYILDDGSGGGTGGGLTEQDIIDLRVGSQLASIANDQATLQVVIEQSADLETWSPLQTESVTVDAPPGTTKQFFRYRMQD